MPHTPAVRTKRELAVKVGDSGTCGVSTYDVYSHTACGVRASTGDDRYNSVYDREL